MGIRLADEFHREAERAIAGQEQSRDRHARPRPHGEDPQHHEQHQPLEKCLVEHRGVARQRPGAGEDHAPGQVGGPTPQLGVDEVADSTEEQADRYQRGNEVGDGEKGQSLTAGVDSHGDQHAQQPAVEAHAAIPDGEDRQGRVKQHARLVEQHIADSPAQYHAQRPVEEQIIDLRGGNRPVGRRARRRARAQAPAKPNRYISPYQWMASGPICKATGSMRGNPWTAPERAAVVKLPRVYQYP